MRKLIFAALAATTAISGAHATLISKTLTLNGTDIYSYDGSTPPIDPISLTFSITFDNSADIEPTSSGLTLISTPFVGWDPFEYTYVATNDTFILGTHLFLGGYVVSLPDGKYYHSIINNFSTDAPDLFNMDYTTGVKGAFYGAETVSAKDASAVPEPSSWAMFIGGFGLPGASMRRRKVSVRFS